MLRKTLPTLYLKIIVRLIGLAVLLFILFVLPRGIMSDKTGMYRPILIGTYLPAFPFFVAAWQIMKLLKLIETEQVFEHSAVYALKAIKYCGLIIGGLYAVGLPYIFMVADYDDAPGVMLLGLLFTFAPLLVGVLSGVLVKLLLDAINIKAENEKTV